MAPGERGARRRVLLALRDPFLVPLARGPKRFHAPIVSETSTESSKTRRASLYLMAFLYVAAGLNHFRDPGFYLRMMPPYLPWHEALVAVSGVIEVALGLLLLPARTRRLAGLGIIALLVAVFPANLHMALHPSDFADIPRWGLYLRLPIQALLIAWAWWTTVDPAPAAPKD